MTKQEFIEIALNKIAYTFPSATIQYQFKHLSQTHFIQISPIEIYEDEKYMEIEDEIEEMFETLNSDDDLGFLTDNSLTQLNAPTKVIYPETSFEEYEGLYTSQYDIIGSNILTSNAIELSDSDSNGCIIIDMTTRSLSEVENSHIALAA